MEELHFTQLHLKINTAGKVINLKHSDKKNEKYISPFWKII